jgi:hypothetical protein
MVYFDLYFMSYFVYLLFRYFSKDSQPISTLRCTNRKHMNYILQKCILFYTFIITGSQLRPERFYASPTTCFGTSLTTNGIRRKVFLFHVSILKFFDLMTMYVYEVMPLLVYQWAVAYTKFRLKHSFAIC